MKQPIRNLRLAYSPQGDVTQYFGENPKLYNRWGLAGHNGIDLVRPHGEPLYAIEDATVVRVNNDPEGYGKYLRLLSKEKGPDGWYREWTYGHNSQNLVEEGQEVRAGELIALMGNTGFVISGSTPFWDTNPYAGTHVHLGLRKIRYDEGGWKYPGFPLRVKVRQYNNGYKGSEDPVPLLLTASPLTTNSALREMKLTLVSLLKTLLRKLLA